MNRQSTRIIIFGCVVAVIAIFVCGIQSHREKQAAAKAQHEAEQTKAAAAERAAVAADAKQKADREAAAAKAVQDAAAEHQKFVEKYVDTGITKKAGNQMVAVAVASETGSMNHAVAVALISRFKADHVQLTDSFFKPELVTDGLFSRAFNGSSDLFNSLELAKSLDALLLARQTVLYETNADLNGVITANMTLEIAVLPVAGQNQSQSWTLSANGTGFRSGEARMQAEERITKQIETDTKMSLGF
jgi:hypothetical protein